MDELKLKPCPFCGGKARVFEVPDGAIVYCKNFNGTHVIEVASRDKVSAIEAWNRRADDEIYIEALDRVAGKWALDELNRAAGRWAHADAENGELRELVRDMYKAFMHGNCYRWCEFKEPCNYISDGKCQWYDRMRELGIEVDG